jgi:hypothetical protein
MESKSSKQKSSVSNSESYKPKKIVDVNFIGMSDEKMASTPVQM